MLTLASKLKIYVYAHVADMRKGIDGLSGIVREAFSADPTDGSLFVFVNRRRDRLKILFCPSQNRLAAVQSADRWRRCSRLWAPSWFDSGGFWLYYRVLEAGTFEPLVGDADSPVITIDATQLAMLLAGVSLVGSKRRRKRVTV